MIKSGAATFSVAVVGAMFAPALLLVKPPAGMVLG